MVLPLEPNLERDKIGDVGRLHDTYIIHISKFMITRDHTLLISNPFSLKRPFGRHLLFDIFLFNYILRQTFPASRGLSRRGLSPFSHFCLVVRDLC